MKTEESMPPNQMPPPPLRFHPKMEMFTNPKKIKDYLTSGHDWELTFDGFVDPFAMCDDENHNGPRCKKCGYQECWHCHPVPPKCPSA